MCVCSFCSTLSTRIVFVSSNDIVMCLHNKYSIYVFNITIKWCHTIETSHFRTLISSHLSLKSSIDIFKRTNDTNNDYCCRSIVRDTLYRNLLRMARVLCSVNNRRREQLLVADDQRRREYNTIYDHCRSASTRETKWTLVRQVASVCVSRVIWHSISLFAANGKCIVHFKRPFIDSVPTSCSFSVLCAHTRLLMYVLLRWHIRRRWME